MQSGRDQAAFSRSHLYVPADQPRLLRSATSSEADALILDLEDGVAPAHKRRALDGALEFLGAAGRPRTWVRLDSSTRGADFESLIKSDGLTGVWIPKAESVSDVDAIATAIFEISEDVAIGLLVESAAGLVALRELTTLTSTKALQLGEVDLRADLDMDDEIEDDLTWARCMLLTHGVAAGIDTLVGPVFRGVDDTDGFAESCRRLKRLGYRARACIHPRQVAIANRVFGVTSDELAAAHDLLERFRRCTDSGQGVFRDADGSMIDAAAVRRAARLTQRASRLTTETADGTNEAIT